MCMLSHMVHIMFIVQVLHRFMLVIAIVDNLTYIKYLDKQETYTQCF